MNRIEMVMAAIDKNRSKDAQSPVEPVVSGRPATKHKYRIVYNPEFEIDPCVWQLQERVPVMRFFWRWKEYANFSSATSAANEILELMEREAH